MSDPEKFLEGALEATSTPWNPPDFTVPAEDFDRVMEALEHPEPTPPELLAKRDEVFEKLGKPKFRENVVTDLEQDQRERMVAWCRELVEQHVGDVIGFCEVCHLRMPCDIHDLAELVLELYAELKYQKEIIEQVTSSAAKVIEAAQTWGVEYEDTGVVSGMTFSTEAKAQYWIDTALPGQSGWHAVPLRPGDGRRVMID